MRARATGEWLDVLRREYPLTGVRVVRDLGGHYNLNLQLATDQGHFVVRVSPAWVDADRLAGLDDIRGHLRSRSWPIPRTVPTRAGCGWVRRDGRLLQVEQYIEPRGVSMTTYPAIGAGVVWLARLHDDLRAAAAPPAVADPPRANHVEAGTDLTAEIAALRAWSRSTTERSYLDAAQQVITRVALEGPRIDLPRQLVHGDFWAGNVHLEGDRLTLLLDFDFLGVRPRIDDLALTLFFVNDHLGRDDTSVSRIAILRSLVDRYDAALGTPLSPAERAALPYALARTPLTFLRDLAYLGPPGRDELNTLRGPQFAWAQRLLGIPGWCTALS